MAAPFHMQNIPTDSVAICVTVMGESSVCTIKCIFFALSLDYSVIDSLDMQIAHWLEVLLMCSMVY